MFSLKPKKKNNPQQEGTVSPQQQKKNQKQENQNVHNKAKPQSKKVSKTVFEDPFYYRIQLLPQEQASQTITQLTVYLTKLRQAMPYKPPREGLKKVIKFETDKNMKQKQSPLISPQIVMGIKQTKIIVYNFHKNKELSNGKTPHLTLIFYEQKYKSVYIRKHDILMQLLCLVKMLNCPYLLLRDNMQVNRLLGVRTVGSLCLLNEQFANNLLKYIGKCLINVPWLIQVDKIMSTIPDK